MEAAGVAKHPGHAGTFSWQVIVILLAVVSETTPPRLTEATGVVKVADPEITSRAAWRP